MTTIKFHFMAIVILLTMILSTVTHAKDLADANVVKVVAYETSPNIWTFNVSVEHPDSGWDDYCNGWNILLEDGTVLKSNPSDEFTRVLLHPHETEQPFTRSQNGLHVPANTTRLRVQAHDMIHGFGGKEIDFELKDIESARIVVRRIK